MIRRPPRSTLSSSSAASDVYKRQMVRRPTEVARDGVRRSRERLRAEAPRDVRPCGGSLAEAESARAARPRASCDRCGYCDGGFFFEWRVGCGCFCAAGRATALPPASFTRSKNDPRLRVALTRRAPAAHRLSRGSPERLPFGCRGLASHVDRRRLRRRHRAFALAPGAPSRMKAILLVPSLPGPGFTGDRLRAEIHLQALCDAGFETTIVGGAGPRAG